jgi:hypothetical protein
MRKETVNWREKFQPTSITSYPAFKHQTENLQKIAKNNKMIPERKNYDIRCSEDCSVRDEIAVEDGLLMRGCRLIFPTKVRTDILKRIHGGHQGITKCRMLARESMCWPGISTQIEEMI